MKPRKLNYSAIGERIRKGRIENELTQDALAEQAGISASFVGHIERGEKIASLETIAQICEVLSLSMDYVARGISVDCSKSHCSLYKELSLLMKRHGDNAGK